MYKRIVRLFVASVMTALLAFSQAVLAGYECQFISNTSMSGTGDMPDDCMMKQATTPSTICNAHCEQNAQIGSQSTHVPTPTFSWIAWMHPLPTLMPIINTNAAIYAATDPPLTSPTTPLRLQYQVFRI